MALVGYRVWWLRTHSGTPDPGMRGEWVPPALAGIVRHYTWSPGVNVAECWEQGHDTRGMSERHIARAPAQGCHCGFWMFPHEGSPRGEPAYYGELWTDRGLIHALERWADTFSRVPYGYADSRERLVVGMVETWGRIIHHEEGSRVEKATPIALLHRSPLDRVEVNQVDLVARRYDIPVCRTVGELVKFGQQHVARSRRIATEG